MTPWKVQSLRVTVFLHSEVASIPSVLEWEHLTGAKPENVMNRGQQQVQEGPLRPGRLLLQKQMGRLDVIYGGFPRPDEAEDPVATLGNLEEAWNGLRAITPALLKSLGPVVRLALGTELVQPAETTQAAYRILVDHIRSQSFELQGGQEFVYQINRPRKSEVSPPLLLNRLTRWNASSWQPVAFELGAGPRVLTGPPKVGAVITTDINTDSDRTTPLQPDKLSVLLEELLNLTAEIRDKGDIA